MAIETSILNSTIRKITKEYDQNKEHFENFAKRIEDKLDKYLKDNKINYIPLMFRVKEKDNLRKKIRKKAGDHQEPGSFKYQTISDITDVIGGRVVMDRGRNFIGKSCTKKWRVKDLLSLFEIKNGGFPNDF